MAGPNVMPTISTYLNLTIRRDPGRKQQPVVKQVQNFGRFLGKKRFCEKCLQNLHHKATLAMILEGSRSISTYLH